MSMRIVVAVVGLILLSAISISDVSAHHSYLLTVQQLRAGLGQGSDIDLALISWR